LIEIGDWNSATVSWKRATPPAWRHVFLDASALGSWVGFGRARERGRKCAGRSNSAGQKFPLHRQIAVDPQANILEYRALGGRHTACLRYAQPAPTTDEVSDANLFRDGLRPGHKRHVAPERRLIRQRQRNHVAGQQRGAGFSRLRQDEPAERMREEILKSLGMTEQQFEKLSPMQQQAVNQKIQQIMLQQI
jgi:hypothetical protein